MLDKLKSVFGQRDEDLVPKIELSNRKDLNQSINKDSVLLTSASPHVLSDNLQSKQMLKKESTIYLTADDIKNIITNKQLLSNLSESLINNNFFMQMLVTNIEQSLLKTLEVRYDFMPTDKLKQMIKDKKSELDNINLAVQDKAQKLELIEKQIALALQDMAPKIQKMLNDITQSVLHNAGTNSINN